MSYVIQRNEDGAYVAPPGMEQSYTKDLTKAQIFPSYEAAKKDCCGNETAVPVDSLLGKSWI